MNLLHLRYFYEVGRTRSFTESSRNLRVSQPAISKMVRALESQLGKPLIERSRRNLRLTPDGELVFEGAARIFAEAREIETRLSEKSAALAGEWSIGVSDNIAVYLLPRPLGEFKARHPGLRISVFSGTSRQIKDELREERCQVGLFYTPLKRSEPFESRVLFETEFWVVVAPKACKTLKRRLSIADLRRGVLPRIESRHADYSGGFPAHFHSRKLGFTAQPWLEVNQHEMKKRLVLEGYGFALLTRHTVEHEVAQGQLLRVPTQERLAAPVHAAWKKGRKLDRVSERFLSSLRAN